MSSNAIASTIFVGIDVSKATLDVYRPDTKEFVKIENTDEAISQFCLQLEKKKRQVLVVVEGTGGYEYLLVKHLASYKLAVAVVNPRRVRDFAKGILSMQKLSQDMARLSYRNRWQQSQIMS
jgi:transposase